jgi:hypothetical protein
MVELVELLQLLAVLEIMELMDQVLFFHQLPLTAVVAVERAEPMVPAALLAAVVE